MTKAYYICLRNKYIVIYYIMISLYSHNESSVPFLLSLNLLLNFNRKIPIRIAVRGQCAYVSFKEVLLLCIGGGESGFHVQLFHKLLAVQIGHILNVVIEQIQENCGLEFRYVCGTEIVDGAVVDIML